MSWSGGKDAARAVYELSADPCYEVTRLLATASKENGCVSHHQTHVSLLRMQADRLGLPLDVVELPVVEDGVCVTDVYADIMRRAMNAYLSQGIRHVGFGDLYLEDLRKWRESRLAEVSMKAVFPLWGYDTRRLAESNFDIGFRAYVVSVQEWMGEAAVGVPYDRNFLENLPADVDPCGENGEFHTFVYDAPNFRTPICIFPGKIYRAGAHLYAEIGAREEGKHAAVTALTVASSQKYASAR